ncbi:unnamed protein product [Adineta ricciae]|uniref:Exostosin GT47 domain-containing protein n=1 Tax=Adineta ricciae TaxID=249248 RepID=A0A814LR45_ADIRI|nr:unnamed protein product [Adineta ricciae]CAF1069163.1 unnamed protein product [Adineta ricciae]
MILSPQSKTQLKDPTITFDLQIKNRSSLYPISSYYRHATSVRNSSHPFISGDTIRAFADYIYDETRQDDLKSVKYGDIIFVKGDQLSVFFDQTFSSIPQPFVLISHNSDVSVPLEHQRYLSNSKILMWYASNPSHKNLEKLVPIPIGLANTRWKQGNLDIITYALKNHRKSWSQRTSLLYVNFSPNNNRAHRDKAFHQATMIPQAQIIKDRISFQTYLEHIGNTKFVLSPPGNGLDCHRTWESLLMGAVPIVLTSELDPLFTKTRSVIINNWSDVTNKFLLSLNFSSNDHLLPDVLYAEYWRQRFLIHRTNLSKT